MTWIRTALAITLLLVAVEGAVPAGALARGAAFSFDSVWFYRDGTRVVPEISKRWITVGFNGGGAAAPGGIEPPSDNEDNYIQKKARGMVKGHPGVAEYLYDPNLATDACFLKLRKGLKPEQVRRLMDQLGREGGVRYVHPALVLDNRTYAYFDAFDLDWKTGTPKAQRDALLRATHVTPDEGDEKGRRHRVDLSAIPFFRAVNLLSEDVKVRRATPALTEIKPSISAKLALLMQGGNVGDGIPFTLTIAFSDRVAIDPSSIATVNLRPPEVQKELFDCTFDPYDYARAVAKSPITITGKVRCYAPGEFSIPPVKISYSCPTCSDAAVRSIETEPVLFRISSMIPSDKSENRLIVPTDPVPRSSPIAALHRESQRYRWLAVACVAGVVGCIAWLLLLVARAAIQRRRATKRRDPRELAERLRELASAEPTVPHSGYLGELGSLLREYLVVLTGGDERYQGGSGRQFLDRVAASLPRDLHEPLAAVLGAIDRSVALDAEREDDIERLQQEILRVVDLAANGAPRR